MGKLYNYINQLNEKANEYKNKVNNSQKEELMNYEYSTKHSEIIKSINLNIGTVDSSKTIGLVNKLLDADEKINKVILDATKSYVSHIRSLRNDEEIKEILKSDVLTVENAKLIFDKCLETKSMPSFSFYSNKILELSDENLIEKFYDTVESDVIEDVDKIVEEGLNKKPWFDANIEESSYQPYQDLITNAREKNEPTTSLFEALDWVEKNMTELDKSKISNVNDFFRIKYQEIVDNSKKYNIKKNYSNTKNATVLSDDFYRTEESRKTSNDIMEQGFKATDKEKNAVKQILKIIDENGLGIEDSGDQGEKIYQYTNYSKAKKEVIAALKENNPEKIVESYQKLKYNDAVCDNLLRLVKNNFSNDFVSTSGNIDVGRNNNMPAKFRLDLTNSSIVASFAMLLPMIKSAGLTIDEFADDLTNGIKKVSEKRVEKFDLNKLSENKSIDEFAKSVISNSSPDLLYDLSMGRALGSLHSISKDNVASNSLFVQNIENIYSNIKNEKAGFLISEIANFRPEMLDNLIIGYGTKNIYSILPKLKGLYDNNNMEITRELDLKKDLDNADFSQIAKNVSGLLNAISPEKYPDIYLSCDRIEQEATKDGLIFDDGFEEFQKVKSEIIEKIKNSTGKDLLEFYKALRPTSSEVTHDISEHNSNLRSSKEEFAKYLSRDDSKKLDENLSKLAPKEKENKLLSEIDKIVKEKDNNAAKDKFYKLYDNILREKINSNPYSDLDIKKMSTEIFDNLKGAVDNRGKIYEKSYEIADNEKFARYDAKDVDYLTASKDITNNLESYMPKKDSERIINMLNSDIKAGENRITRRNDLAVILIDKMSIDDAKTKGLQILKAINEHHKERSGLWKFFNYFGQNKREKDSIASIKNLLIQKGVDQKDIDKELSSNEAKISNNFTKNQEDLRTLDLTDDEEEKTISNNQNEQEKAKTIEPVESSMQITVDEALFENDKFEYNQEINNNLTKDKEEVKELDENELQA